MAVKTLAPLPLPNQQAVDKDGNLTPVYRNYLTTLDALLRAALLGPLPAAANDATAAQGGVPVNGLYQNAGAVRVRLQ